jgi:hypothetical protein
MVKAGRVVVALPAELFSRKYLTPNASQTLTDFYASAPPLNKKDFYTNLPPPHKNPPLSSVIWRFLICSLFICSSFTAY